MEERTIPVPTERPIRAPEAGGGSDRSPLDDPRALTILTTEHWSLLSARSLVYNEAFSRAGMFLTFLSATLVALGLVSNAMAPERPFLVVAAVVLAVDLFVGLATMGRVQTATDEDVRYVQGMNRIRHAYHEVVPGLDRYFIAGKHDDIRGVFEVYGAANDITSISGILHGFTTVIGMIGVISSAVAGALSTVILLLLGVDPAMAGLGGVVVFGVGVWGAILAINRSIAGFASRMNPIFPTPSPERPAGD
jgi:hypothetical protein